MGIGPSNSTIEINNNIITKYVLSYTRNKEICSGIGTLVISVDSSIPYSIQPWNIVILYEEGIKIGTYSVISVAPNVRAGTIEYQCQDDSIKLVDYFIDDTYEITTKQYSRKWLERFLEDACVDYFFSVSGKGTPLSNNSSLGLTSAYDAVTQLLQQCGWYMYFDADNVCHIGTLKNSIEYSQTIDDNIILSFERNENDSNLRNRAVIYGGTDDDGGSIHVSTTRHTPYDYDNNDLRTIVFSNGNIGSRTVAKSLVKSLLDTFACINDEKTIELAGSYDFSLGENIYVDSKYYSGICKVTTVGASMSSDGLKTKIILDQQCPRLFAFFGAPEEPPASGIGNYVYVGLNENGIWRKDLQLGFDWEPVNSGIYFDPETDHYITDLYINSSIFVTIVFDKVYFKYGTGNWFLYHPGTFTDIDGNIYQETEVFPIACTMNKLSNNIILGYILINDVPTDRKDRSWVVTATSGGYTVSKTQLTIGQPGTTKPVSDLEIQDVDNNTKTNIISTLGSASVLFPFGHRDIHPGYFPETGVTFITPTASGTDIVISGVPNMVVNDVSDWSTSCNFSTNFIKDTNHICGINSEYNVVFFEDYDLNKTPVEYKDITFTPTTSGYPTPTMSGNHINGYFNTYDMHLGRNWWWIDTARTNKQILQIEMGTYNHLFKENETTYHMLNMNTEQDDFWAPVNKMNYRHYKFEFTTSGLVGPVNITTVSSGYFAKFWEDGDLDINHNWWWDYWTDPIFCSGVAIMFYWGRKSYNYGGGRPNHAPTTDYRIYGCYYNVKDHIVVKEQLSNIASYDDQITNGIYQTYDINRPIIVPTLSGVSFVTNRVESILDENITYFEPLYTKGNIGNEVCIAAVFNYSWEKGWIPNTETKSPLYSPDKSIEINLTDVGARQFKVCGQYAKVTMPIKYFNTYNSRLNWIGSSTSNNAGYAKTTINMDIHWPNYGNNGGCTDSRSYKQYVGTIKVPDGIVLGDPQNGEYTWTSIGGGGKDCTCDFAITENRNLYEQFILNEAWIHPLIGKNLESEENGFLYCAAAIPSGLVSREDGNALLTIPSGWENGKLPQLGIFSAKTNLMLYPIASGLPIPSMYNTTFNNTVWVWDTGYSANVDDFDNTFPIEDSAHRTYFVSTNDGSIVKTMTNTGGWGDTWRNEYLFFDGLLIKNAKYKTTNAHYYNSSYICRFKNDVFNDKSISIILRDNPDIFHTNLNNYIIMDWDTPNTKVEISNGTPVVSYNEQHTKIYSIDYKTYTQFNTGGRTLRTFNTDNSEGDYTNYLGETIASGLVLAKIENPIKINYATFSGQTNALETTNKYENQYLFVSFSGMDTIYEKPPSGTLFYDETNNLPIGDSITIVRVDDLI